MPFGTIELALVVAIIVVIFVIFRISTATPTPVPEIIKEKEPEKKEPEKEKPKFTILYGSQSGTAETFSEELKEEGAQYGFEARVIELEEYDFETELENEGFTVFLMATYGEGEPTDDAITFYEWIMEDEDFEDDKFSGAFSVFALGNRQYEHFCNVGKNVHKKMAKHGGTPLFECGTGDDDGSLDDDFAEWKAQFWEKTKKHFQMENAVEKIEPVKVPFKVNFVRHPNDRAGKNTDESKAQHRSALDAYKSGPAGFHADAKYQAKVMSVPVNRELRQDTFEGNTRHIELELPEGMDYTTADNLGVFAHNDFKLTGKLITRLGQHPKTMISLKSDDSEFKNVFPSQCTVMDALLWYCDHSSVPRSGHLKTLSVYCSDDLQKAKLLNWAGGDKQPVYKEDKKNWLEVLEECPALDLPFDVFLHIVPKLSPWPRYYTISSSSNANPRHVSVTVTAAPTKKKRGRVYNGICSTYLLNLSVGSPVCAFIKPSSFRLPKDRPVIMVGPGTGVAPFRAFWQEAKLRKAEGKQVEDWVLFFGCRYSKKDWIYKEEMQDLEDLGIETHYAFSRDQKEKVYVQNLMEDQNIATRLWSLVHTKKARIFVCGATSMGRSVKDAFTRIALEQGSLSETEADKYIKGLMDSGEYIQELWS